MQKFVFFDRDGVINSDVGHYYIFKAEDFKINDGIIYAMHQLQANGFKFIVVSNQGGVSKGIYTKNDVHKVHEKFLNILEKFTIVHIIAILKNAFAANLIH
ncbi:MAG: HAD-IIIA family hydrolase [Salinivirgaceae bacterium]|nr:HAD-IIIA family hydrolase [Salinivirgaceae bacterium]